MITISNLTKKYGDKYALDNISFNVKKGEVLGFLGPNGAGRVHHRALYPGERRKTAEETD